MLRVLFKAMVAFVAGLVAGWAVSLSACLRWWDLMGIVDRDGGAGIAAFFIIGPFFGLVSGILAATVVLVRSLPTGLPVAGQPVGPRPPSAGRLALFAVAVALALYLVLWCFIELSGPYGPRSVTTFIIQDVIPLAIGIGAGIFAANKLRRSSAVRPA